MYMYIQLSLLKQGKIFKTHQPFSVANDKIQKIIQV